VGLEGLGAVFKGAGKAIGKGLEKTGIVKVKPNAEEIEAATKAIGGKATPAQLVDSRAVNRAEMTQWEMPGRLGGMSLRKQIQGNIDAAKGTAKEIIGSLNPNEADILGRQFGDEVTNKVAEKLAPATSIYKKWEGKFKDMPVDREPIRMQLSMLADDFKMDSAVTSKLQDIYRRAEGIQNLNDLKKLRTAVGGEARESLNPEVKRALEDVYVKLRDARSDAIMNMADAEGKEIGAIAKREIEAADKTYRQVILEVQNVIGEKFKGSPTKQLASFLENTPSPDRMKKIMYTNDVDSIKKFAEDFPAAFTYLRDQKVSEIAAKAMDPQGIIDPKKLVKNLDNMPEGSKALLLGADAPQKLKQLQTYLQSLPSYKDHPNPSKTSFNSVILSFAKGGMDQLMSFKRSATYDVLSKSAMGRDSITMMGEAAATPFTKGAVTAAGNAGILLPRKKEEK
jgi:uncharacterized protein YjbJ (UPF0337 family)